MPTRGGQIASYLGAKCPWAPAACPGTGIADPGASAAIGRVVQADPRCCTTTPTAALPLLKRPFQKAPVSGMVAGGGQQDCRCRIANTKGDHGVVGRGRQAGSGQRRPQPVRNAKVLIATLPNNRYQRTSSVPRALKEVRLRGIDQELGGARVALEWGWVQAKPSPSEVHLVVQAWGLQAERLRGCIALSCSRSKLTWSIQ